MAETHYEIDITAERLLPLSDLPDRLAAMGVRRPHVCAVRRWVRRGVKGVILPSVLVGDRRYTSMEALRWWVARSSATEPEPAAAAAPPVTYPLPAWQRRYFERRGLMERTAP